MAARTLCALIVDDEPRAREVLRYYLAKAGGVSVIGEADNGAEAIRIIDELKPDVVFLDVKMPEIDGVELARLLKRLSNGRPYLVFVTAFEEHAVAAFEIEAVDYLVKPLTAARIVQCVERLRRWASVANSAWANQGATTGTRLRRLAIGIAESGRVQRTMLLETSSILAVEAQGKGSTVWTRKGRVATVHSISELETILPQGLFFRVHRSYLVNTRAISELFADGRTYGVRLEGFSDVIPVSRERVQALRDSLGLKREKSHSVGQTRS